MQILNWILPHKNLLFLPSGHKDITFMPNTGTSIRFSGLRSMKSSALNRRFSENTIMVICTSGGT